MTDIYIVITIPLILPRGVKKSRTLIISPYLSQREALVIRTVDMVLMICTRYSITLYLKHK